MSAKQRRPPGWAIGCSVALVLGGACVGLPVLQIRAAGRAVDGYCATVSVGAPTAGLAERARAASLEVIESPARVGADGKPEPGRILAWRGFGFVRRFCNLEHDGAKVTKVYATSLD